MIRRDDVQAANRIFLTFLVIGTALLLGVPYIWNLPEVEVRKLQQSLPSSEKLTLLGQSELVDKRRSNLVGSIGTLATIVAGVVLFLNYRIAQERLRVDTDKIRKDARLAESRLIAERFSQAIEHIGNDNIHIRLGGIFSLEKLIKDSPNDYWTVMEVLTAFIRKESPYQDYERVLNLQMRSQYKLSRLQGNRFSSDSLESEPSADIHAALAVVRRQTDYINENSFQIRDKIVLYRTNLLFADLDEAKLIGADLSMCNLITAHLSHANLRKADFSYSAMQFASLKHANLSDANLDNADLHHCTLSNANLSRASLDGTNLYKADLTDANLEGATVVKEQLNQAILCRTKLPKGIDINLNRDCPVVEVKQSE